MKNSPILNLLKYFKKNVNVSVYEPSLTLDFKNKKINQINNLQHLLSNSDLIIIIRPWTNKKEIEKISKASENKFIIDPFRMVQLKNNNKNIKKYFTIGK